MLWHILQDMVVRALVKEKKGLLHNTIAVVTLTPGQVTSSLSVPKELGHIVSLVSYHGQKLYPSRY